MTFKLHEIVTRRNTRQGRGEVIGFGSNDRIRVKWEGSEEPDHYRKGELDYFNPETDEI